MQDLIHIGIMASDAAETGSTGMANRSGQPAGEFDPLAESLDFSTLLALAASLHRPLPADSIPYPVALPGASLSSGDDDGAIEPMAGSSRSVVTEQARTALLTGDESSDMLSRPEIRNLFSSFAADRIAAGGSAGDLAPAQESQAVKKHQVAESFDGAPVEGAKLSIAFRSTRQTIPVNIERPLDVGNENISSLFSHGRSADPASISARSGNDASAPDLRIVARNDGLDQVSPAAPSRALPDLRLVVANDGPPERDVVTDLAERLARGWRQSFVDDGPAIDGAGATGRRVASHAEGGRADNPDLANGERSTPGARPVEQPSATVVPLFGDLIVNETASTEAVEPAMDIHRAAVEIAREARRLERMGGTELSFTLRLYPEHLGQVEIEIQRIDNRWTVAFTTAGEGAREALAAEVGRLENAFRLHNLALDRVTVTARVETTISAPDAAGQTSDPGWQEADGGTFAGRHYQDESGWRNDGPRGIIRIDSSIDNELEQEVTTSHARPSLSGIDIQA